MREGYVKKQCRVLQVRLVKDLLSQAIAQTDARLSLPRKRTSDVGCSHTAFVVEDLKAAIEKGKAAGLTLLAEPCTMSSGPGMGAQIAWLRDWDGHSYELTQLPEGFEMPS